MKKIDELINEAYPGELAKLLPIEVDEETIRAKTLAKLGLAEKKKPEKKRGLRAILVGAGTLAACVALMFTVNLAFPAFAESIPGLGGLFQAINAHNRPNAYNEENLSRMEEHLAPVSKPLSSTGEGDLRFTVQEAYYDGKNLYCTAEIETELDPNREETQWEYTIYINGKKLDFDYRPISRDWVKTGENTYANDEMSTQIPEEFRPEEPENIRVKYEAVFYDHSRKTAVAGNPEMMEIFPEVLCSATAEFTAKYDSGETVRIETEAEQNGVRFLSFSSSPAGTEIVLDVPREVARYLVNTYASIQLYTTDGQQIRLNSGSSEESDIPPELNWRLSAAGEGLPRDVTQVVVSLMFNDNPLRIGEGRVIAEFTVDLAQENVVPSERWMDLENPLYWDEELEFSPNRVFASYRAKDKELEKVKNGYQVEYLCNMDGFPLPLLNLVTDQEYRELHVELLDEDGVVLATADTQQSHRMGGTEYTMFQPFDRYDMESYYAFSPKTATDEEREVYKSHFGEKRISFLTGGEIKREMDKSGLNSQAVFLEWYDGFSLVGDRCRVRITDGKTGALLHEEILEMSLPENLELGENQRLLKLRGAHHPYVIVDVE